MPTTKPECRGGAWLATGVIFIAAALLLTWRAGAGTLFNGDDAVYAQFVREMRRSGDLLALRLDGVVLHQRPPLYPWLVYLSTECFGEGLLALRLPAILAAAGTAALVFRLGLRVTTPLAAGVAAALYPTAGLVFLYARSTTSDTTLVFFILLSMVLWLRGRVVLAGAALGAALMTKQVVGLMPLIAPAVTLVVGGRGAMPSLRRLLLGAGAALLVWAPWHGVMLARYGDAFVGGYIGENVLRRATSALLPATSPAYYLEVLWHKESLPILFALAGLGVIVWRLRAHWRERESPRVELALLIAWPLAVLGAFSIVSSRIDYYALPAYPALALLMALPVGALEARRRSVARVLAVALVAAAALLHLPERIAGLHLDPRMRELADLASLVRTQSAPGDELFVVDEFYLLPRWYSDRRTTMVVTDPAHHAQLVKLDLLRVPGTVVSWPASGLMGRLDQRPRWYAIVSAQRKVRLRPGQRVVVAGPTYTLYARDGR
ncbi:MAG: phospholipid carrier-dependent glycosyltransferase [Myxococcales bacterium]|nr:phospholipid carrier-dependent glycosyltransferase [Myxococcales bacterium]